MHSLQYSETSSNECTTLINLQAEVFFGQENCML